MAAAAAAAAATPRTVPPTVRLDADLGEAESSRWRFEYDDGAWQCAMQCMRCQHQVRDRRSGALRRCKRMTCYTLPYCWQHLVTVYRLRIGRTRLVDKRAKRLDFLGLFACDRRAPAGAVVFRKGDRITPYIGELIDKATLDERYPGKETAPYTYRMSENRYVDAACMRGVGALANACIPSLNPGCKRNNARFVHGAHTYPNMVATKTIRNGDEIYLSYGPAYFAKSSVHRPHRTVPVSVYRSLHYRCLGGED